MTDLLGPDDIPYDGHEVSRGEWYAYHCMSDDPCLEWHRGPLVGAERCRCHGSPLFGPIAQERPHRHMVLNDLEPSLVERGLFDQVKVRRIRPDNRTAAGIIRDSIVNAGMDFLISISSQARPQPRLEEAEQVQPVSPISRKGEPDR